MVNFLACARGYVAFHDALAFRVLRRRNVRCNVRHRSRRDRDEDGQGRVGN